MDEFKTGIYRHYKNKLYLVTGRAVLAGTEESEGETIYVIYRPLYGKFRQTIRPCAEFFENVQYGNQPVQRFRLIFNMMEDLPSSIVSGILEELNQSGGHLAAVSKSIQEAISVLSYSKIDAGALEAAFWSSLDY